MMQLETFTEAQIVSMLNVHYQNGVRVRSFLQQVDLKRPCASFCAV